MQTYDSVVSYFRAGQACIRSGKRDQALVLVGEILRRDPLHPLALCLLRELEDTATDDDVSAGTGIEHWRAV